jgi:hypothetical protein
LFLLTTGLYGYAACEARNYHRTRVLTESTLDRYKRPNHPRGLYGQDVHDVTVLGAVSKPDGPPELLYAVTSRRPLAKTHNLIQWSGQILGMSKNLLFSKVIAFLKYFRPDSLEILYCGECATSVTTARSVPDQTRSLPHTPTPSWSAS